MNIIFLCGCLEPGRDGVGDYTRRLAGELIRQGHLASIVALNDPHVKERFDKDEKQAGENMPDVQILDGTAVPVLRLSRSMTWSNRMQLGKGFIDSFNPDWLSLQVVPYSFHPKGLPFGLPGRLKILGKGRKWHVMFHELWLGLVRGSSFRQLLMGWFQRRCVEQVLDGIRPAVINTSNSFYQALLSSHGIEAEILPLYGAFGIETDVKCEACLSILTTLENASRTTQKSIRMVIFGSLNGGFPFSEFLRVAKSLRARLNVSIDIVSIGNAGERRIWESWEEISKQNEGIRLHAIGPLSPKQIRFLMSIMDCGIAMTPLEGWGKSSAIAAMLESGLPVFGFEGNLAPPGLRWKFEQDNESGVYHMSSICQFDLGSLKRKPQSMLQNTYRKFASSLEKHSSLKC